jgi:hypothetical protein
MSGRPVQLLAAAAIAAVASLAPVSGASASCYSGCGYSYAAPFAYYQAPVVYSYSYAAPVSYAAPCSPCGDSYGYAGLSWTFQAPVLPVFVEASLGGVARTSLVTAPQNDPSRNFGCGFGARVAGSVGLNLPAGTSLIATVEHLPDFGTCGVARANTNLGVRLGFRF